MVTVVIVNWNSGPMLERCLQSLHEHAHGHEIVIVDNHSSDSSMDCSARQDDRVVWIENSRNAGFAAACNQGWRAGTGEEILFLNPDTECLPGAIENLRRPLQDDAAIWSVGGCLVGTSGKPQAGFNVRAFPSIGSVTAELLLLDELWPANPWTRRYRMTGWNYDAPGDVDQPAAACLMVRRTRLEALGGFDERFYPAWFEDVDLCRRIRSAGGRIVFEPSARFLHHGGVSMMIISLEHFLRYFHTNQIRYFAKHHGPAAAARVRSLVSAGLRLRALCSLHHAPRRSTYWRAARCFARNLKGYV